MGRKESPMATCENAEYCTFFEKRLGVSPSLVQFFKKAYYQDDFEHCARYMLREKLVAGYHLPAEDPSIGKLEVFYDNLFPNDRKKALQVIERLVA